MHRSTTILLPSRPVTLALTVAVLLRSSCWRAYSFSSLIGGISTTRRLVILPLRGGKSDTETEPLTGWLHNTKPKTISTSITTNNERGTTMDSPAMKRLLVEKMKEYRNHRIISPPAIHPCGNKRAMVTEHRISVPLHHIDMENTTTLSASRNNTITLVNRVDSAFDTLNHLLIDLRLIYTFVLLN